MSLRNSIVTTMKNSGKFSLIRESRVMKGISILVGSDWIYTILVIQPGQNFRETQEYPLLPEHFKVFLETNFAHKSHPQAFVCDTRCVFSVIDIIPGNYKVSVDENGVPTGETWYTTFCLQRLEDRYLDGQIDGTIDFVDKMTDNLPKRELETVQGLLILQSAIRL